MSESQESQRKEIVALKEQLRDLKEEKEKLFTERKEIGKQIAALIREVKEKRKLRNSLTDSVREDKEKRKVLNKEIRDKIQELKELRDKQGPVDREKSDPIKLKKDIERLMYKVETEGMSFANEKKLMKVINEKQHEYEQVKGASGVFEELRELSKEIDELKKKANDFHKTIQDRASDSQKHHEEMIEISNRIDSMKTEEKDRHEKFLAVRKQFNEVNRKLNDIMGIMKDRHKQQREEDDAEREARKQEDIKRKRESLKEKAAEVNEKMKNNQKLTTEDLMILQQADE